MIIFALVMLALAALFATAPMTWLLMLFAGNVGFAQYGFWDLLPGGAILAALVCRGDDD